MPPSAEGASALLAPRPRAAAGLHPGAALREESRRARWYDPAVVVTHRSPRLPFEGAVSLWACHAPELPDRLERSLPDGRVSIYVNLAQDEIRWYEGGRCHRLAGASLGGARAHAYEIDTREQRHVVGATFTPGTARAFFDTPLDALSGQHVSLAELWGRDAALLRERLLEAPTDLTRLAAFEAALRARCR